MRVILIDDHALFRVGLQGLLERRGIDVVAAVGDPEEGIRLAAAEPEARRLGRQHDQGARAGVHGEAGDVPRG